ncbi:class I SAM-dependent methyltransferase [Pedobacter psychroterrae]|uniref:Class I SAM-dependent methyltransferase n=1 Tax=Pedobacter psychroterrae TaxID=2530453 RepID=A0A4R0NB22_9SPHI|nr:class I SAM-dependent methyltransferase [Pedobacter psychroterrae]TCC96817.1 class I SAM-dependent methyltransferase [Pedobacter psychroterrae]
MITFNLEVILNKIQDRNLHHAVKLRNNTHDLGDLYHHKASLFLKKYEAYLQREGENIDFGINRYLIMLETMLQERIQFIKTGQYSNTSFEEVEKSVYANPEAMVSHMHGLVLAQFLWPDQYTRFLFFSTNFHKYFNDFCTYLEIGGGHGLYLNEAIELFPQARQFDLVDISQSSIDLAKGIIDNDRVNYYHKNVYDFDENEYNFITMGEVLEHVEDPLGLLTKTVSLLSPNGVCYITTPINSPMLDHIYLFNDEEEIRTLFHSAGLQIIEEKIAISDNKSTTYAKKNKTPVMYAAFLKKI